MVDDIMEPLTLSDLFCGMNYEQRQRLGTLIKELREEAGMSQRQYAAKKLDCSYAALRSWEQGESVPGLENMERIADLKGWTLSQLLDYVRGEESVPTLELLAKQAEFLSNSDRLRLARMLLDTVE